nr:hypothetical protein [uncultured Flavobacterium sp.]
MITIEQQQKGAELMKSLIEKAWENATFKDQFVENPVAAIKEFTNKEFTMPENKRLVVEDQTDNSIIFLNIPSKPNYSEIELTDEQLDIVAGGEIMCVAAWGVVGVLCLAGGVGVGLALR